MHVGSVLTLGNEAKCLGELKWSSDQLRMFLMRAPKVSQANEDKLGRYGGRGKKSGPVSLRHTN
jgi:hypothetical protein